MRRIIIIIFLVVSNNICFCQRNINLYDLGISLIKKNQYLKAIDTIYKLRLDYKNNTQKVDSLVLKNYDQALTLFKSFVGEVRTTNDQFKEEKTGKNKFLPAIPYIVSIATKRRIIMINEDHNQPKHRILTFGLLNELYKNGFKYLAIEALIPDYPNNFDLNYPSIYFAEPNMTNLATEARKIGYKLIAYESQDTTLYDPKRPYYMQNLRELNQANNLSKILIKDPEAKILIHAGMGHIWKHGTKNIIFMAEYLKTLTGIDPLSINQSVNNPNEFNEQLNRTTKGMHSSCPYVVLDTNSNPVYSNADKKGDYDLLIAWKSEEDTLKNDVFNCIDGGRVNCTIDLNNTKIGNLIQIIKVSKQNSATPTDQFIIKYNKTNVIRSLNPGDYKINEVDINGISRFLRYIKVDR